MQTACGFYVITLSLMGAKTAPAAAVSFHARSRAQPSPICLVYTLSARNYHSLPLENEMRCYPFDAVEVCPESFDRPFFWDGPRFVIEAINLIHACFLLPPDQQTKIYTGCTREHG